MFSLLGFSSSILEANFKARPYILLARACLYENISTCAATKDRRRDVTPVQGKIRLALPQRELEQQQMDRVAVTRLRGIKKKSPGDEIVLSCQLKMHKTFSVFENPVFNYLLKLLNKH